MIGDRLAVVARRLLRDETFLLVAAPAIADLQFEAPRASRLARLRAEVTVGVTIARVACTDLAADFGLVPGALQGAWPSAATFWRILATCAAYYGFLLWFLVGLVTSTESMLGFLARANTGATVGVVLVALVAALVSAVALCLPERRRMPASFDGP